MSAPPCDARGGIDVAELRLGNRVLGGSYAYERAGVTITRQWAPDLEAARAMCAGCPLLLGCTEYALERTDVQGFAAGMLEGERAAWRKLHGVKVRPPNAIEWLPPRAAQEPRVPITDLTIHRVRCLRAGGATREEIATDLGISWHTVKQVCRLIDGTRPRKRDEVAS